jgi:hypothetical protein
MRVRTTLEFDKTSDHLSEACYGGAMNVPRGVLFFPEFVHLQRRSPNSFRALDHSSRDAFHPCHTVFIYYSSQHVKCVQAHMRILYSQVLYNHYTVLTIPSLLHPTMILISCPHHSTVVHMLHHAYAPRSPTSATAFQLLSIPSPIYALLCVSTDSTQNNTFLACAIATAIT